jgi:CheY-like chemotaxis protein
MNLKQRGILLVEDDPNDVFFMERAMSSAQLAPPVFVAVNGEEAINYLAGRDKFADRTAHPLPDSVFLDLKLPFISGFEVLEWIRTQPSLSALCVIVLTSSPEERDRQRASELGAKAYLLKPPNPQMLLEALESSIASDPTP